MLAVITIRLVELAGGNPPSSQQANVSQLTDLNFNSNETMADYNTRKAQAYN